ncbi:MAG: YihY/virulence factor BrkB family protein [Desulforhabdus sp.]|jgi:membrane protein|nr:YihY/virulence factor BrkB family protein [Desulforhabdus sp.]
MADSSTAKQNNRVLGMLSKLRRFVEHDLWRIRLGGLRGRKQFFIKLSRILVLSMRGFASDQCSLRASALTFYSLLSVVPIFAMAFGIAKGFGLEKAIERQILIQLQGQEEVARWIIGFAYSFLETTTGGVVAGIGVVILFWTVIKVLNNIECSFNAIWKTYQQRSVVRKITDYLSIMLIAPIFWVIASSVTVFIVKEVDTVIGRVTILSQLSPFIQVLLRFTPYLMTWVLFCFIYIVMPNTKVNLLSGIAGGIIAGTIYQAFQYVYINFQIGVTKYNAVYGSFAALPLFLVWLQASWLILLFGAEISFAYQNVAAYEFEPDYSKISYSRKKLMILGIIHLIVKKFANQEQPPTAQQISDDLDIPNVLVHELLREAVQSGIVSEVRTSADYLYNEDYDPTYQPAFDINKITLNRVIVLWESHGLDDIEFGQSAELSVVSEKMQELSSVLEKSLENKLLKDI